MKAGQAWPEAVGWEIEGAGNRELREGTGGLRLVRADFLFLKRPGAAPPLIPGVSGRASALGVGCPAQVQKVKVLSLACLAH